MDYQSIAAAVFENEARSILSLKDRLNLDFSKAVDIIDDCKGKVILSGMGKSGLIAKKIAATLSSIGKSSIFLHPSEAIHGDLGVIMKNDCLISISNSGETDELLQIIPHIKSLGIQHISILGKMGSTLSKYTDCILDSSVEEEASPLQAVPLASTICAMAIGDALAAALIFKKGIKEEDFALNHPGGNLGRKILAKVSDFMQKDKLPIVSEDIYFKDLLMSMSRGMLGIAIVLNNEGIVSGIITDGDIRRSLEGQESNTFFNLRAIDMMTTQPISISPEASIFEAEELMNKHKITSLLVFNGFEFVGVLAKHFIK
jgi:arabinose-5-phosphate isomerase